MIRRRQLPVWPHRTIERPGPPPPDLDDEITIVLPESPRWSRPSPPQPEAAE